MSPWHCREGSHAAKIAYQMNLTAASREFTIYSRESWGKGYKERPIRAGCVIRSMGAYTETKDRLTHRSTRRQYFWTYYDSKGTESDAFGAIASSVKWGFCGQTMGKSQVE